MQLQRLASRQAVFGGQVTAVMPELSCPLGTCVYQQVMMHYECSACWLHMCTDMHMGSVVSPRSTDTACTRPPQLNIEPGAHIFNAFVYVHTHLRQGSIHSLTAQVCVGQEFLAYTQQGVSWPVAEPVNCAAVDEGWELPAPAGGQQQQCKVSVAAGITHIIMSATLRHQMQQLHMQNTHRASNRERQQTSYIGSKHHCYRDRQ